MNNGSILQGGGGVGVGDGSPTYVMRTLFSKLQLGSLEINLGMTWVYSGTTPLRSPRYYRYMWTVDC